MKRPAGVRPDIHERFERVWARAVQRERVGLSRTIIMPEADGAILRTGCYWRKPFPVERGDPSFEGALERDDE